MQHWIIHSTDSFKKLVESGMKQVTDLMSASLNLSNNWFVKKKEISDWHFKHWFKHTNLIKELNNWLTLWVSHWIIHSIDLFKNKTERNLETWNQIILLLVYKYYHYWSRCKLCDNFLFIDWLIKINISYLLNNITTIMLNNITIVLNNK